MVRVSKNLQLVVAAMLCTALAGCSSDPAGTGNGTGNAPDTGYEANALKLIFSPMYSAFGGAHVYQVPVTLDGAALDPAGTDPVKVETVKWQVDEKMVSKDQFPDIPGSVLLTTKASGMTDITALAETRSGRKIKGTTTLHITKATDAEWDAGQARYDNGKAINFMMLVPGAMGATGGMAPMITPGMILSPMAFLDLIPKDASCGNCHNNQMGLTVEHTPLQTAGYSDEELVRIFTMGAKPMGAKFNSPFLKNLPGDFANTIYSSLHKWTISAEEQQGIVLKLRSITPKVQPDIDITRLRMMFMNMMPGALPGAGAAGSAAPPAAGGAAGS